MFNDLGNNDDKKNVEPFNLVGIRSLIYSKEDAAKILKNNSYYIFVAAGFNLGFGFFDFIYPTDIGISTEYLILSGIFYCAVGAGVRMLKSRIASLLALGSFGYTLLMKALQEGQGGFYLFLFIFCLASYRAVKASFYYHNAKLDM
jgi:hypothetical protein